MATSGSIDYIQARETVIQDAMELCAVVTPGVAPISAYLTTCATTLNLMLKHWQAKGVNLFAIQTVYVFLQKNVHEYSIGASTGEYTASFVSTTIDGALSSGVSAIVVDSATGISSADRIGVEQSDGTMHWTTVNGAPSGTSITLTAATTAAVADGATVYAYTSRSGRFMKVIDAYVHHDGTDIPIDVDSRQRYWENPDKTSDGRVLSVYYDPQIGTGKLFVYPETNDVSDYLILHVKRTLHDMDQSTDNFDFPQEWYLPIVYNLAWMVAPKFQVPVKRIRELEKIARESLDDAMDYDVEGTSIAFEIDRG